MLVHGSSIPYNGAVEAAEENFQRGRKQCEFTLLPKIAIADKKPK